MRLRLHGAVSIRVRSGRLGSGSVSPSSRESDAHRRSCVDHRSGARRTRHSPVDARKAPFGGLGYPLRTDSTRPERPDISANGDLSLIHDTRPESSDEPSHLILANPRRIGPLPQAYPPKLSRGARIVSGRLRPGLADEAQVMLAVHPHCGKARLHPTPSGHTRTIEWSKKRQQVEVNVPKHGDAVGWEKGEIPFHGPNAQRPRSRSSGAHPACGDSYLRAVRHAVAALERSKRRACSSDPRTPHAARPCRPEPGPPSRDHRRAPSSYAPNRLESWGGRRRIGRAPREMRATIDRRSTRPPWPLCRDPSGSKE